VLLEGKVRVPIYLITAHYYLEDMVEELGPTLFVPGSHLSGRPPRPEETGWRGVGPRSANVKAGSCVMFRSDVWHSGSPNLSGEKMRENETSLAVLAGLLFGLRNF